VKGNVFILFENEDVNICSITSYVLNSFFFSGTAEDLVDTFFEVEVEMEKEVCRDLVCTSPKDEEGFLFNKTLFQNSNWLKIR
jgi:hypothetical protein